MTSESTSKPPPRWRQTVILVLKLSVGVAIIAYIASKLAINDEVDRADGTTVAGRNLRYDTSAALSWTDARGSHEIKLKQNPALLLREDARAILDANGVITVANSATFVGAVLLEVDDDTTRIPLTDIKVTKRGRDDGYQEASLEVREGLATIFSRIEIPNFLLAMLALLVCYLFSIRRWQVLLQAQDINVRFREVTRLTFIGFFFNNVVPGSTGGDVVKAAMIARAQKGRGADAVSTVIVDRVFGLLVLAMLSAVVLLFNISRYRTIATWLFAALGLAFLAVVLFLSRRVRRLIRLNEILKRLPGSNALMALDRAFLLYRSRVSAIGRCVVLSLISQIFFILSIYILGLDVGVAPEAGLETPAFMTYVATVPIIMIASAIPALPGGWGVGEAAFALFFRTVGIHNLSLSVGLSVLSRFGALLWSLVGGVFLLRDRRHPLPHQLPTSEESEALIPR